MHLNRRTVLAAVTGTAAAASAINIRGADSRIRTGSRPTKAQQLWQDCEVGAVFHYDLTTFQPGRANHMRRTAPDPKRYSGMQEPCVIRIKDRFVMFYGLRSKDKKRCVIGRATLSVNPPRPMNRRQRRRGNELIRVRIQRSC